MVKDMRYIIKKIIIGVGIALAIMFIKTNVFAMETKSLNPSALAYTNSGGNGVSIRNFGYYQKYGSTWSYWGMTNQGNEVPGGTLINNIYWYVPNSNKINDGSYDLSFLMRLAGLYSDYSSPYNIWLVDLLNNNIYSCYNYTNNGNTNTPSTLEAIFEYVNVTCPNVTIKGDFRLYVGWAFSTNTSYTEWGISPITAVPSGSSDLVNAINSGTQATQQQTETITDSSIDNSKAENDISNMQSKIASNGTITQLLTLPITLYQAILNSVNGSCSPYSLGSLLGYNLTLPCINLQSYLGSTIWGIIDMVCSGLFILVFRKKMVDIFNHMTSLNDRGNELE